MTKKLWEIVSLAFVALFILFGIVCIILLIFHVSGQTALLSQMLVSNTAEGKIQGILFKAYGPFGMWVVITAVLMFNRYVVSRRDMNSTRPDTYQLFLQFENQKDSLPPPSTHKDFKQSKCVYSILKHGQPIVKDKPVIVQIDENAGPYVYVKGDDSEDVEYTITFQFNNREWLSDSHSSRKAWVKLHESR